MENNQKKKRVKILEKVVITGIADKGKAVGRDSEGMIVFVENAAPGDVVDVKIHKEKSGYQEGTVINIHTLYLIEPSRFVSISTSAAVAVGSILPTNRSCIISKFW